MSTLLDKALVMIAAHHGAVIWFRVKGGEQWAFWQKGDEPAISWNWSAFDYEIAPDPEAGRPSFEAQAGALPSLAAAEGDDSGAQPEAVPGASSINSLVATQELAFWMLHHGFATGHGDTMADLLKELAWQVGELREVAGLLGPTLQPRREKP